MDNETNALKNEEATETTDFIGERTDEVLDSTVIKCKTMTEAIKLSISVSGFNYKEVAYLIGYGEHPEQLTRMLNGAANFPSDLLNLLMDKLGNEIPLRWLALKRSWGLHRTTAYLQRRVEELEKESEEKDKKIVILEDLIKRSA